jgi:hypothetical protein
MPRHFKPPWTSERIPGSYVLKDATGPTLAYVYARETLTDADIAKVLTMDEARRLLGVGFGRRSLIFGASVARERHPSSGKASMIVWLRNGSLHSGNSAPSLAGLFVVGLSGPHPREGFG